MRSGGRAANGRMRDRVRRNRRDGAVRPTTAARFPWYRNAGRSPRFYLDENERFATTPRRGTMRFSQSLGPMPRRCVSCHFTERRALSSWWWWWWWWWGEGGAGATTWVLNEEIGRVRRGGVGSRSRGVNSSKQGQESRGGHWRLVSRHEGIHTLNHVNK
jgi:hypothetical protein